MAQAPKKDVKIKEKRPVVIDHSKFVKMLEHELDEIFVIDVRTKDFVGGNIPNAINIPKDGKQLFDNVIKDKLFEFKLYSKKYIVFHCMYCQQRGPNCANIYCKLINKLITNSNDDDNTNNYNSEPPWVKQHRLKQQEKQENNNTITDEIIQMLKKQQVCILKGGFNGWYNAFEDDNLTQYLSNTEIVNSKQTEKNQSDEKDDDTTLTKTIEFVANVDKKFWKLFQDDVSGVKKFVHIYDC